MWITNGTQADWLCLLVRTSDEGGYQGMSMIVMPTDSPGFSVGRTIDKMGNRSSDTAELVFDDVRVPVSNTIGEIGRGFQQQMAQFTDERLIGAYMSVSSARHALDKTKQYLQDRSAFGKPLLANQYLQYRLAELYAEVDLLQTYCRAAAFRAAEGEDVTREATVAKLKCGRLQREVADACVQFHGGMGYAEEMWPARYFRDARLTSIGGGADEVMLRVIAMMEGMGRK
jgi:citronellyl-CoA dehydrogenase